MKPKEAIALLLSHTDARGNVDMPRLLQAIRPKPPVNPFHALDLQLDSLEQRIKASLKPAPVPTGQPLADNRREDQHGPRYWEDFDKLVLSWSARRNGRPGRLAT